MFSVRGKISPKVDFVIGIGGLIVAIAIWCAITYSGAIKPLFLPSPTGIFEGLADFHRNGWLTTAILKSSLRVTLALVLVIAIGIPLGIAMGSFPFVDAALRKLVNGAKSVPTTGVMGLVVLWFSIEERAKIVFLFIGAIFYMVILVRQAVLNVSEDYLKVAADIGAKPAQMLSKVLFPAALPQIWEAIAVSNGIMWTYIVLAEYINNSEEQIGLGYLLYIGMRTQESGKVFGVLIIVAVISATTDFILTSIRKRWFPW